MTDTQTPRPGHPRQTEGPGLGRRKERYMYLYLGEPDFEDVESAARLYNRYLEAGGLSEEGAEMFMMMCSDHRAVLRRAAELRGDPPPPEPVPIGQKPSEEK